VGRWSPHRKLDHTFPAAITSKDPAIENVLFESVLANDTQRTIEIMDSLGNNYERKIKANARDKTRRTPLFYAVFHDNYEIVNFLLQ
jgi:ankyrin repeat protein